MKLRIKIGDMRKDIKEVFQHPEKASIGTHTIYLKHTEELYALLSPKRMELLNFTLKNREETITQVSKALNRKQTAISRDASVLQKYNIIKKTKDKQKTYIVPQYTTFEISLTG